MQEYDFAIHYKKVKRNTVANAFSKLCDVSDREQYLTAIEEYIPENKNSINSVYKYTNERESQNNS